MGSLSENRLRIVKYFDDLKNKVDINFQSLNNAYYLGNKQETNISQVNAEWEKAIEEIDTCAEFNLNELEKRTTDKHVKLNDELLFKKIIFEFEVTMGKDIDMRLIAIDTYITPGEVECFKSMMTFVGELIQLQKHEENHLDKLFMNVKLQECHQFVNINMSKSTLDEWRRSLKVIRVASVEQLAVVEKAELWFNFDAIQPDAEYLFRKTFNLTVQIHSDASSVNTSRDPFSVIHGMPELQNLHLRFDPHVKRVDYFSPSLPKLKIFKIFLYKSVEFSPTAFDSLNRLDRFEITADENKQFHKFETSVAPEYLSCSCFPIIKLNTANIKRLITSGTVESSVRLSALTVLEFAPDINLDLALFVRQLINLHSLKLYLSDLSQVDKGQLDCLSNLRNLALILTHQSKESHTTTQNKLKVDSNLFKDIAPLTCLEINGFFIESGAFKHLLDSLTILDLKNNPIECIVPSAFKGLRNLNLMFLNETRLEGEHLDNFKASCVLP